MTANSSNKDIENENDNNCDEQLFEKVLNDIAQKTEKERNLFTQTSNINTHSNNNSLENSSPGNVNNSYDHELKNNSFEKVPEVVYTTYQPTPMELLKESFKWSAIVALITFVFMQPAIINKFLQYLPNKLISESGQLNLWGTLVIAVLAGFIYFILYQWIL